MKIANPIVKKMITKLTRAISDSDVRRMMDVEDEIEGVFKRGYAEKDKEIETQRQRADAEQERANIAEQKAEAGRLEREELLREIENLKKNLKKE